MMKFSASLMALSMLCASATYSATTAHAQGLTSTQAKMLAPTVQEQQLRPHLALLSSDLFEGRGTGQRGGELTVAYLEAQATALGLTPFNGKSYRQAVPLVGMKTLVEQSKLQWENSEVGRQFQFGEDWVWSTTRASAQQTLNAPLVFAGFGIQASEENWDDYKNVDVKGKIVVLLPNDPQPTAEEPNRFEGKGMTYYGRRSYKVEEALKRGAVGVVFVHLADIAGTTWASLNSRADLEVFQLKDEPTQIALQGWISEAGFKKLVSENGGNADEWIAAAGKKEFRARPMSQRIAGTIKAEVRQLEQFNVGGIVKGTDPKLQHEVIIYTAHWDHLGMVPSRDGKSTLIYNGAIDNGTGTSALLAMAKAAQQQPAKRSILFLWVAAEEQGLLGSAWYANHPIIPLKDTVANLNLDTMNFVGRTKDISLSGADRSEIGQYARGLANDLNLTILPPRIDTGGYFFRSDHFSFVRNGIPAYSVSSGGEYEENHQENAAERSQFGKRYHQVTDRYDPKWSLQGTVQQAQFALELGYRIALAPAPLKWKKGEKFGKILGRE